MNRKIALALALAAAGAAHADDITIDPVPFQSTLSRAEVVADLMQFRQSGINPWADEYDPIVRFRGSRTRAEVTAEFMAQRQAVAALNGEDSGSAYLAQARPARIHETQLAGSGTDAMPSN